MSMQELNEALRIIEENPAESFFAGPRDPSLIANAEAVIENVFPPTYREFVVRLGAGSFGGFEIYGVTNANFENGKVPNGVWLTLKQRRAGRLPQNLLVIGDTGDGSYYCVDMQDKNKGRVVIYQPGIPAQEQQPKEIAQDFGSFLLSQIREQL